MSWCESCGRRLVARLIYFNDGGPTFGVCRPCAISAGDHGCSVYDLEASA